VDTMIPLLGNASGIRTRAASKSFLTDPRG
jgi:hypothetical protein